jgi:FtsH-binding integral membrane protein
MAQGSFLDRTRAIPLDQTYADVKPLLKWVYAWMLIGLIVTTFTAVFTTSTPALLELTLNPVVAIGAFVVQIGLVIALSALINRISPTVAAVLFLLYAATLGFSLSLVLLAFNLGSLAAAFGTTAVLFGIMTFLGFTTDIDLSRYSSLLLMALIGLIVASVVNMLIGSGVLTLIISVVGVLIFMGLVAYDTQNLKRMAAAPELQGDSAVMAKYAVYGALMLYIDFVNIFLFLLQIMGGSSSD